MKPSPICYIEIPALDIERAGKFYGDVFGWAFTSSELTNQKYWMFTTGDGSLMGGLDSTRKSAQAGVVFYINVEDINATLVLIEAAGGRVDAKRSEIGGGYGYSALFRDPNGNQVGLWEKGTPDPAPNTNSIKH